MCAITINLHTWLVYIECVPAASRIYPFYGLDYMDESYPFLSYRVVVIYRVLFTLYKRPESKGKALCKLRLN